MGMETEEFLDYQGRAGFISIVRWNLFPVIFGVDLSLSLYLTLSLSLQPPSSLSSWGGSQTSAMESPIRK